MEGHLTKSRHILRMPVVFHVVSQEERPDENEVSPQSGQK